MWNKIIKEAILLETSMFIQHFLNLQISLMVKLKNLFNWPLSIIFNHPRFSMLKRKNKKKGWLGGSAIFDTSVNKNLLKIKRTLPSF